MRKNRERKKAEKEQMERRKEELRKENEEIEQRTRAREQVGEAGSVNPFTYLSSANITFGPNGPSVAAEGCRPLEELQRIPL